MELELIDGMPDYSLIVDMIRTEWPEPEGYATKTDEEIVKMTTGHHDLGADWVKFLYDEHRIVGYYRCGRWPRNEEDSRIAHLFDIAVDQRYQKRGLGTFMLNDVKKECRNRGYTKIMSRTIETNTGSRRLHETYGFHLSFKKGDSLVWEFDLGTRAS